MYTTKGKHIPFVEEAPKFRPALNKVAKLPSAGVCDLDVHNSGRVLLSCAKDNTIRLWDLIKARCILSTKGAMPLSDSPSRIQPCIPP